VFGNSDDRGSLRSSSRHVFLLPARAVRRDVEVADRKLATEIGQLPLASGLEIDEPELLVRDVSLQDDQRIVPADEGQSPGAGSESGSAVDEA
jgi:hypothetical protein